jgi:protein SCO1
MTLRFLQISFGILLGILVSGVILYPTFRGSGAPEVDLAELGFLPVPLEAPAFTLTSHRGESFSSTALEGRPTVVFFGFTHCPDVCPITLLNLTRALERIPDGAERVQGIMITVDPARDDPERLAAFMKGFDPSFVGLTGEADAIEEVARGFGVSYFERHLDDSATEEHVHTGYEEEREARGYLVDHTARSYVLDGEGRIVLTFAPYTSPERMAEALERLLALP